MCATLNSDEGAPFDSCLSHFSAARAAAMWLSEPESRGALSMQVAASLSSDNCSHMHRKVAHGVGEQTAHCRANVEGARVLGMH